MRFGKGLIHCCLITSVAAVALVTVTVTVTVKVASADEGTLAYGGKLYDKWYKVIKAPKPKDTHPAWPASNTKKKGDATQRCKACHGWDYMGKDGAYATGSYKTGIMGVRKYAGASPDVVVAVLKNDTHGYSGKMSDADLNALAMFVTKGQVVMDNYIDRNTKKARGDVAKGKDYYGTMCVNCHGADGMLPKDMPALGGLSNKNPWEVMHKILNGQPDEKMPGLRALPIQITADLNAYLQTLPKK